VVLYDGGEPPPAQERSGAWSFVSQGEAALLRTFWSQLARSDRRGARLVTFNGRTFDGPFLMQRSAVLGVAPSRNLVPYRFSFNEHCDLLEVLTFFGAVPKVSLDYLCRAFGIETPKKDLDGSKVDAYFKEGRAREIAAYCAADVDATAALYRRLLETLLPVLDARR
jgi:predicted PolB exonuclease-like 3'-5' exonuclease